MTDETRALTDEQNSLFTRFLSSSYGSAVELLDSHRPLIDDNFLAHVVEMSQRLWATGDYDNASSIADLGSCFDDLASVRTKIDLRLAAGNGFAGLEQFRQASRHAYEDAIKIADSARTPYKVPAARLVLGQFASQDGSLDQARALLRAAAVGALDPASEVPRELFWAALKLYGAARPKPDTSLAASQAVDAMLVLVPRHLLDEFHTNFKLKLSDQKLLEMWAEAKGAAGVIVDGIDPLDDDVIVPFVRSLYSALPAANEAGSGRSSVSPTRYSTNVLTDRVINRYPFFSSYVTREALADNPKALSILSHEFTHHWTFLGSLGGYFSAVALELRLLSEFVTKPSLLEELKRELELDPKRVVAAYDDAKVKLRRLWEIWRPWAEGLALFAEIDLDLLQSGPTTVPLTVLLASMPTSGAVFAPDQPMVRRSAADPDAFSAVERLQSQARRLVSPLYRKSLYLGKTGPGNESYYFTGHGLVNALWRQWGTREPRFHNSVCFCRALLWLSHSAFDDLIPDWRLPRDEFADDLTRLFASYLRQLFEVRADQLSRIADALDGSTTDPTIHDLWRHIQGAVDRTIAPVSWETRTISLVSEIAEAVFDEYGMQYVELLKTQRHRILDGLLNAARTHTLSQSDCEFRIVPEPPTLVGVARSIQGGPSGLIVSPLTPPEMASLVDATRTTNSGSAQLYQFLLARPDPNIGFTYTFPVGVMCDGTLTPLTELSRSGRAKAPLEEQELLLLQQFLDPGVQKERQEIADVLETLDPQTVTTDLETFADRVDTLYLDAFMRGPADWIQRLRIERLRAFLPASGPTRAVVQDILDHVMREPLGVAVDELVARLNVSPESVASAVASFVDAARVLGQELLAREGGQIRFTGLRAST